VDFIKIMKRSKLFYVSIAAAGLAILALVATLVTGLLIKVYVTQEKIDFLIAQIVSKQTGGKLEYKVEKFDVLNEIKITGIRLTGPSTEIGVHEGGSLASRPIISIDQIEINPSVRGVWRRVAKLKWKVDRPQINLWLGKDENNLAGLLAYRAKNFPPEPSLKPWYELPVLPFTLDKISIPGLLEMEESVISGLSLHLKTDDLEASFGPLDFKSQLRLSGKEMTATMQTLAERLQLSISTKKGSGAWNLSIDKKFQMLSWTSFQAEGSTKISGYKLNKPLLLSGVMSGGLKPDLTGLELSNLALKMGPEIGMNSEFKVSFPTHSLLTGTLETKAKFQMGLSSPIVDIATQLFDLSLKGNIRGKLETQGQIEISPDKKIINLPKTELNVDVEDFSAQFAKMIKISDLFVKNNIDINTKDGEISIILKEKMQFSNLQFEKKETLAEIKNFNLENLISGDVFSKKINKVATQIKIEKITAKMSNKTVLSEPFLFDLNGNSENELGNLVLTGAGSLGELLEVALEVKCNNPCKDASITSGFQASKIMPIIALAKNNLADEVAKMLPTFAEGKIKGDLRITANIPDLKQAKLRIEDFSPKWALKGEVAKLSIKIPAPSGEISNLNANLQGEGDLTKASLKSLLKLDQVEVTPNLNQKIGVSQIHFNSETQLQIPNMKTLKETMATQTNWHLKMNDLKLTAAKEFVFPNHEATGVIKTLGIDEVWLILQKASLVDGGIIASLNAHGKPSTKSFETDFESNVTPAQFEKYVPGLKASGALGLEGKIAIENLEKISIQLVSFLNKIKVNYQFPDGKQVASIGFADGKMPIIFKEKLSDIKKWFEKIKADSLNEKVSQYLVKESQIVNLSLPEAPLVSWRDAKLESDKHIRIQKAYLNGVGLDEFDGNVEITSKAILVKNFQGKVLGGRFQGNAFIPISPYPERVVLTAHVKGIEASQIPRLVGKEASGSQSKNISGNFHLDFMIRNNLIDGLFDITSIGSDQMSYMLEMVDPDHADASINNIRRALKLGTLRKANVKLKRGELSLDLDIRVAGLPVPLPKLDGIKVTNMIENIKADLMSSKEAL
jgi:hypothetical protein